MAQYGRQTDEFGKPLRRTDQHGDPVVRVYGPAGTGDPLTGTVAGGGEYGTQQQYGSTDQPSFPGGGGAYGTGGTGYGTEQKYERGGAPVTSHLGATGTTGAEKSDPYAATGTTGAYQTHSAGVAPQSHEGGRGLKEKIKDVLPGGGERHDQTHSTAATGGGLTGEGVGVTTTQHHEKKGMMEKIKEKLPGHHHH